MKDLGFGQGYRLAHYEADKVAADLVCLPDSLVGAAYYRPTREGNEGRFKERLEWLRGMRARAQRPAAGGAPAGSATADGTGEERTDPHSQDAVGGANPG